MTAEMAFGLLGPLSVSRQGRTIHVTAGRQRAVLAALLLSPGRVLGWDDLAEVLWGANPPSSARVAVQNYVMRLRRLLGDGGTRLATWPGGYAIDVAPGELDLYRAEELMASAREATAAGAWDVAADRAGQALALWRGQPLADVPSETLSLREVPRLAEFRLRALELRIDADLHLGDHVQAIGELRQVTRAHPLRERLHELLVLALYREGRRAEALDAYQEARRILVEELGVEPRDELRELQRQVLASERTPAGTVAATARHNGSSVPRQLPAGVPRFTCREPELADLHAWLRTYGTGGPGVVVICAIDGTAGVGKTALAVHWAHQVAGRFPDGQLYVNLRGYDPGPPMRPQDAVAGFLRALGVPGPEIPADPDERSARYRGLLAGRQMLIVLDNASGAEQVRPLLPGAAGCAVMVTSRDRLAGLVARDGAVRLELDLMPAQDAVNLLRALIGRRAEAEPAATEALAARCCRLPLALRVAAELAVSRPGTSLASLTAELAGQQRRLDLLDAGGDSRTAVRAVFSWSYRDLDAGTARAFRLAGLHPGPDLDPYAVAALTETTVSHAAQLLKRLDQAHLIQATARGRHTLHDLLRDYAAERADAEDGAHGCTAAIVRLLDYYLHAAAVAIRTLYPAEHGRWPDIPPSPAGVPPLGDPAAARTWLDGERPVLAAVAALAREHGLTSHVTRLSQVLFRYLDGGGHNPEATTIHDCARRAALEAGDRAAEAAALNNLGMVDWRQGRYSQAGACFEDALALCHLAGAGDAQDIEAQALNRLGLVDFQQGRYQQAAIYYGRALAIGRLVGDPVGVAHALGNLGGTAWRQGRYQQAREYLQQALTVHRETGDPAGQSEAMGILGIIALRQGHYQEAAGQFHDALALCRQTGNRIGEADALTYLGVTALRSGQCEQAAGHLDEALDLSRRTGDRATEAYALTGLGELALRTGAHQAAAAQLRLALDLFRDIGDLAGQAQALSGLGETLLAAGWPGQAHARHDAALNLADQIGDLDQQARAHDGLGHAFSALGDADQARLHWQQALDRYATLGAPEAARLRATLTSP
ncbi:MAG TPA: BTAD domain-containing putative transcriptional regulator [Streptosporangiaceae bacterium]|nr:BTAD domain-containing putative transcriptional regulator [Streptosporangiaceae bacterium]